MYAIKLDRDEILLLDQLVFDVSNALPESFKLRLDLSPLKHGRVVAENGHTEIQLQTIADSLYLFISPKRKGIGTLDANRTFQKLIEALKPQILSSAA
jgi:hypothetical protein